VPLKLVTTWGDLGMRLGCVVRVESFGQDLTTSHWTRHAEGVRPGHALREVPVAGACETRRSWGGVCLWDEAPGWRCRRGMGCWLSPLRRYPVRSP
jgi:hypothetical protein